MLVIAESGSNLANFDTLAIRASLFFLGFVRRDFLIRSSWVPNPDLILIICATRSFSESFPGFSKKNEDKAKKQQFGWF